MRKREAKELTPEGARRPCPRDQIPFESTADLAPLEDTIGQERARSAVAFGITMGNAGFHVYAAGPAGTGKKSIVRRFLSGYAVQRPIPDDWCYVHNFDEPDSPRPLRLPAGRGADLRQEMDHVVRELEVEVPQALDSEDFRREKEKIEERFQKQRQDWLATLQAKAEARGFRLLPSPEGVVVAPLAQGRLLEAEDYSRLNAESRQQVDAGQAQIEQDVHELIRRTREEQGRTREEIRQLEERVLEHATAHLLDRVRRKFKDLEDVARFLERVREDLRNGETLGKLREAKEPSTMPLGLKPGPNFDHYRVNLVVDNASQKGAPLVVEDNPSYSNLCGRIEHRAQFGTLVTDFRMIKAGALHRANGGYLVLDVRDVLMQPFAWEALKRALRSRTIRIESGQDVLPFFAPHTLRPEPVPLDLKVVLTGDPAYYQMLYAHDEEFRELFKIRADFELDMEWTDKAVLSYGRFIATRCKKENLLPFSAGAVARVVEQGARMAEDRTKLSLRFSDVADLVREAEHWGRQNGRKRVEAEDVRRALNERQYRSHYLADLLAEWIRTGVILIECDGAAIGQANGISVLASGDLLVPKPARITARTSLGRTGVVHIDREAKLAGRVHGKGVMILSGYLGGAFARDIPLALSASITLEQVYEEVEGDSAASAELYALLSSIASIPLRQDLAVTGSINQQGQIQPVGAVNEKIEGFFDACRSRGLTGRQGMLIPEANVRHVMVREDVAESIGAGQFHIYPVSAVEEGMELLTGRSWGAIEGAVRQGIRGFAERFLEFTREAERGDSEIRGRSAA